MRDIEWSQGFSGAPVWDKILDGVVGMAVAVDRQPQVRAAFIIPSNDWRRLGRPWPRVDYGSLAHHLVELGSFSANPPIEHGDPQECAPCLELGGGGSGRYGTASLLGEPIDEERSCKRSNESDADASHPRDH